MMNSLLQVLRLFLLGLGFITGTSEIAFSQRFNSKACVPEDSINFGVVVYNPYYQLYRSTGLGERGLQLLKDHLTSHRLVLPNKILYMNSVGYSFAIPKSLSLLKSFTLESIQYAVSYTKETLGYDHSYSTGPFASEEEFQSQLQGSAVRIFPFTFVDGKTSDIYISGTHPLDQVSNPVRFDIADGTQIERIGNRQSLYQVLYEILTHSGSLHYHCQGGIHRTGMTSLMIRALQGGRWINEEPELSPLELFAKELESKDVEEVLGDTEILYPIPTLESFPMVLEFKRYGVYPKQNAIIHNLAELEYFHHNPLNFRQENLSAIKALSEDERFQCLKRQFSFYLNAPSYSPVACYGDPPPLSEVTLQPFDRMDSWKYCERFAEETSTAASIDYWVSKSLKSKDILASPSSIAHVIQQLNLLVEKIQISGTPEVGDEAILARMKEKLKRRVQLIQERTGVFLNSTAQKPSPPGGS